MLKNVLGRATYAARRSDGRSAASGWRQLLPRSTVSLVMAGSRAGRAGGGGAKLGKEN